MLLVALALSLGSIGSGARSAVVLVLQPLELLQAPLQVHLVLPAWLQNQGLRHTPLEEGLVTLKLQESNQQAAVIQHVPEASWWVQSSTTTPRAIGLYKATL